MTWDPSTGIGPAALFCLSLALLYPALALAQSKANDSEGTIVSLDHGDIVLDLGTSRGLASGMSSKSGDQSRCGILSLERY